MGIVLIALLMVLSVVTLALLATLVFLTAKRKQTDGVTSKELKAEGELILYSLSEKTGSLSDALYKSGDTVTKQVASTNGLILDHVRDISDTTEKRITELKQTLEKGLSELKTTVGDELGRVRRDNTEQLDKMREVVSEKLDKTLNDRLTQSFKTVTDQLESVYKNLGEINTLSNGMTDLKKMLSNIKTRGTFGEVSLENLLEEILPGQYEKQCNVSGRTSGERVDFAIMMPGNDGTRVYLPIDVKFPAEDYIRIRDAADAGDETKLAAAEKAFTNAVAEEGKRIGDKYIRPPKTTDFAVMYLPTEGLYGEVIKNEKLMQGLYGRRVIPAGPTTLTALLNALQMGFRSLEIQKKSIKVLDTFRDIKKLMKNFNEQLLKVRDKLRLADQALDEVSKKSEKIESKLGKIEIPDDLGGTSSIDADGDAQEIAADDLAD